MATFHAYSGVSDRLKLAVVVLAMACFPWPFDAHRTPNDRPNVILLFMDDLGYGDVGFTGHPTTSTPNLDSLAKNGKIFTTWYSGCPVCTGSRAALMTGRQFLRSGLPGVFGPTTSMGLPLNERTVAQQLKTAGYRTAAVGKWHLGQREVYLPGNRGFDFYLGIPYSDDMGHGIASACPAHGNSEQGPEEESQLYIETATCEGDDYEKLGFCSTFGETIGIQGGPSKRARDSDPAKYFLPLVYQADNRTRILEQPLDFTTLAIKYNDFCTRFIKDQKDKEEPFFLYVPFSHVHTTQREPTDWQYAGCSFKNSSRRGSFGDALAEADWIVGNIMTSLRECGMEENTLVLFTSDNGPWLIRGLEGGSTGLLTGRYAGYWDTGKGSTWEGGIREPAFAYWKGTIKSGSRTAEVVSSLDIMPTLSSLVGVPLPDVPIDGKDMTDILLDQGDRKSKHDFLFFYGSCDDSFWHDHGSEWGVAAVRHGRYKAHWCTSPGFERRNQNKRVYKEYPLLFDIEKDPSESMPISEGTMPTDPVHAAAMKRIMKAYAFEVATFTYGKNTPEPDGPGEGPGTYGLCCDRSKGCNCTTGISSLSASLEPIGILNIGSKRHHDKYHKVIGEEEPSPPRTRAQVLLRNE